MKSLTRAARCLTILAAGWLAASQAVLAAGIPPQPLAVAELAEERSPRQPDMENDPDLYLKLISEMQEKKLYFASLAHLDAFDKRWPANPKAALMRADALRETGYLGKATALYQTLLSGPQAAGAYHGLGILAARNGDNKAALAALQKANRLQPTSSLILNDLGYIQLLAGQLDDARLSLHMATELDPKDTRAGANLALLYLLDNKSERAAGIMQWYQLPETQRKDIYNKAESLSAAFREAKGKEYLPQKAPD